MHATGSLSFVLHAHLPYIRHRETDHALEERWLYETITESYIPLLESFLRLEKDRVPFTVTVSLSPTLVAMLADADLQDRFARHIGRLIELTDRELERTARDPATHHVAVYHAARLRRVQEFFLSRSGNLLGAFADLGKSGRLELITCSATHAFIPLLHTKEAMRAQIMTAVLAHERVFGAPPRGFWLPECGYVPAVDEVLDEAGVEYFFISRHGLQSADPVPVFGDLSPVLTPRGVAAFAGDSEAARQVWSSKEGYPGDPEYLEYYRDVGFDLPLDYVRPYIHPEGIRINTGIKYHRVTGAGDHKELYSPERAGGRAAAHAAHFLAARREQLRRGAAAIGRQPVTVAAFDAELFGHWWHEGPLWLENVLRKAAEDAVRVSSPGQYLELYDEWQSCDLAMSSWGRDGYAQVWVNERNDWIYPQLHTAELRMRELAGKTAGPDTAPAVRRAGRQAMRELLLAQASDWAFMMDNGTTVEYARRRTAAHLEHFTRLYDMIRDGAVEAAYVRRREQETPLFAAVDPGLYLDPEAAWRRSAALRANDAGQPDGLRIVMLSWEFPPLTVGGLSRHVYDLTRRLADLNCEVHVITVSTQDAPAHEVVQGVHVHRVTVRRPDGGEFIHWTLALNMAMVDACRKLVEEDGLAFDLIHAHDWLVGYAASELGRLYGLPLATTIHATEHGRNDGIHTDLQRRISDIEWRLTYDAREVIVCSTYMKREVEDVFTLPPEKVSVLPNGVDPAALQVAGAPGRRPAGEERIVVFLGRLVREKGVQTLIEATPAILAGQPDARIVIIGKGPMQNDLQRQAQVTGVEHRVHFAGFVTDDERNEWLHRASVAVFPSLYEPFGIVALEAMAAGVPVVVSDVGGLADVVEHGRTGYRMIPGDARSLATFVVKLLGDAEHAGVLAQAARQDVERFDWTRIARETIDVYRRCIAAAIRETGGVPQ